MTEPPVVLHHGDCLDVLPTLPDSSVDAVVTDPPYGLEFMGQGWDRPWAQHFTSIGNGPPLPDRQLHVNPRCRSCGGYQRGTKKPCHCATPEWNDSQAAAVGRTNKGYQQWCERWASECLRVLKPGGHLLAFGGTRTYHRLTCAIEDAGFEIRDSISWLYGTGFPKSKNLDGDWQGWGTALKPTHEPIVVARKPLAGTVAANVQAHGTGALNIDGCRVGSEQRPVMVRTQTKVAPSSMAGVSTGATSSGEMTNIGRWPPNVAFTHAADCNGHCAPSCPVAELNSQSGSLKSGGGDRGTTSRRGGLMGSDPGLPRPTRYTRDADSGGASRFFPTFRWQAKAGHRERPSGEHAHPTVKPLALMRWLVRLVTPPDGLVLDPFAGSGTTGEACLAEGFRCILIERDERYLPLIQARLARSVQSVLAIEVP